MNGIHCREMCIAFPRFCNLAFLNTYGMSFGLQRFALFCSLLVLLVFLLKLFLKYCYDYDSVMTFWKPVHDSCRLGLEGHRIRVEASNGVQGGKRGYSALILAVEFLL